jgi:hypothetical protein
LQKHKESETPQRGFTVAEKWVIWAVFCLLVGLSTSFLIFPALLLVSYAVIMLRRATKTRKSGKVFWLGLSALLIGGFLIYLAVT